MSSLLDSSFQGAPRDAFVRGARLFDAGAFFAAHEAWEARWLVETEPARRRLFQGLIQIAAGFHKLLVRSDRASAARLLAKGRAKLEALPEGSAGGALAAFCAAVRAQEDGLAGGGETAAVGAIPKLGV